MNDEQGILRRLDHYADCIEKGVHVTGTQLKSLVKDIRESGLVLSQSPPAEAQAQGGGEVELRHMVAKLAAHVRPTCGELWAEAERLLNRTAPPSAPVGVDTIRDGRAIVDEFLQCASIGRPHGKLIAQAKDWLADAEAALTKQPAAAGEEIMVNAAHDVYTLPLQPSGLSSGPRFVVHVPAPEQQPAAPVLAKHQPCGCVICTFEAEHGGNRADHPPYVVQQPAAVDDAMVRRALCMWFGDPSGNGLDRGVPAVEEWFKRMKAALTAALAAQPGGSDNDR